MKLKENKKEKTLLKKLFLKVPENEKIKSTSITLGNIICILAKHLINSMGYAIASRVISRDIRELGKSDIERLEKLFNLSRTFDDKKRLTRLAGMLLGLDFRIFMDEKGETHAFIVNCPFNKIIKKFNEPFICKVCEEYNRGIVEALFGHEFKLVPIKRMSEGDKYCKYHITKKD